ncbi:MAG: hypothetical protein WKF51_02850 [Geodermatophilaceae bacterium]
MGAMRYLAGLMNHFDHTAPLGLRRALLPRLANPGGLMSPSTLWALLQATVVIALLLAVSGAGRPAVSLGGHGDPTAARAVEVLVGGEADQDRLTDLVAAIPADYASVMGYQPELLEINGTMSLGKPIGTCSAPVRLAFDMEPTCKGHDFGYDLLRYAAAIDAPLGPWARPLIDQWWYDAMHDRCDLLHPGASGLACHGQILTTEAIINVNSWREGYGPPIEEHPWRYLGALLLLPPILLILVRFRPDPLHPGGRLQSTPAASVLAARRHESLSPTDRPTAPLRNSRTIPPRPSSDPPGP